MDDLINSFRHQDLVPLTENGYKYHFRHQSMESPVENGYEHHFQHQNIEPPTEDGYIYHFRDGSPAGSVPVQTATSVSAGPSNRDLFFVAEAAASHPATGDKNKDERDYHAVVDEDDDGLDIVYDDIELAIDYEDNKHGRDDTSRFEAQRTVQATETSYNDIPHSLNRSFHNQVYENSAVHTRAQHDSLELSPASLDDGEELESFLEDNLRRFHRQDLDRDNLLLVCPSIRRLLVAGL